MMMRTIGVDLCDAVLLLHEKGASNDGLMDVLAQLWQGLFILSAGIGQIWLPEADL